MIRAENSAGILMRSGKGESILVIECSENKDFRYYFNI